MGYSLEYGLYSMEFILECNWLVIDCAGHTVIGPYGHSGWKSYSIL